VTTQVAFLRAVNLGKRTAKSAQLVDAVEGLGYAGAWTFINSGNVVFEATGSREALERKLGTAFEKALGFEATTFVRTAAELRRIVKTKPFEVAGNDTHFVTFLKGSPTGAKKKALEALSNDFDTLVVEGRDVHWLMHGRSSDSSLKAKQWDDIVGHHCSTSRNMTGLTKLVAKIDS
jgi:uncharacterized protein (DUF1697 family)